MRASLAILMPHAGRARCAPKTLLRSEHADVLVVEVTSDVHIACAGNRVISLQIHVRRVTGHSYWTDEQSVDRPLIGQRFLGVENRPEMRLETQPA